MVLNRLGPMPMENVQFRVMIEAGNQGVIDALDTAVEDGELGVFFREADFTTFRAVKVKYSPELAAIAR